MKVLVALTLYAAVVVIGPNEVAPDSSWFTPVTSAENEAYRQQKCAEYHISCEQK